MASDGVWHTVDTIRQSKWSIYLNILQGAWKWCSHTRKYLNIKSSILHWMSILHLKIASSNTQPSLTEQLCSNIPLKPFQRLHSFGAGRVCMQKLMSLYFIYYQRFFFCEFSSHNNIPRQGFPLI